MRNIEHLSKQLLASEQEMGLNLFHAMRLKGYPPAKIDGMIYRAGCLSGRDSMRKLVRDAHEQLSKALGRIAELEAQIQGGIEDLTPLADLINNPIQNTEHSTEDEEESSNEQSE